jgi:nucleoside-diphosphate-sugar epimerase
MPSGQDRRVLDVSRIRKINFVAKINLDKGLSSYYEWFKKDYHNVQSR